MANYEKLKRQNVEIKSQIALVSKKLFEACNQSKEMKQRMMERQVANVVFLKQLLTGLGSQVD